MTEAKDWSVYRLTNNKRKEIYHGAAKGAVEDRIKKHTAGEVVATSEWVWGKKHDNTTYVVLHTGLTQDAASEKAHKLEKSTPPEGFSHIQTGGT